MTRALLLKECMSGVNSDFCKMSSDVDGLVVTQNHQVPKCKQLLPLPVDLTIMHTLFSGLGTGTTIEAASSAQDMQGSTRHQGPMASSKRARVD